MNNLIINNCNLFLNINLEKFIYNGLIKINLRILESIDNLEINSKEIKIKEIKINKDECSWNENIEKEIIKLNFKFNPGEYFIKIKFENIISDSMEGFYYTIKNNNIICCTHLEPISARKFIPCFDKPDLKATWDVVVKINKKYNCLSNNSIKKIEYDNSNNKIYYFNSTPKMSTYLLCIAVGDFIPVFEKHIISCNGTKINGYCVKSDKKYMEWSIYQTKNAIDFFEKWFGIKYSLDKLDIISIPNFLSGAMENWGLITFREELILLYNKVNFLEKNRILEVIYHEISHQWFGNLVTLSKWDDLWLNESTATFFSWMALKELYKKSNINELYFLLEYKNIYLIDGITNTHPIILDSNDVNPVELFDEITYSKGNIIINYVANLMGFNSFQKSIRKYLKQFKYSNPDSNNLYSYFNEFSINKKINYVELMNKLIKTKGYPIIFLSKENSNYFIEYKTFNLDKTKLSDYPIDIYVKVKHLNDYYLFALEPNKKLKFNDLLNNLEDNFIFNLDNNLFCICKYIGFIPNINLMNQVELMKFIHDQFILFLYKYIGFDEYFNLLKLYFEKIDLVTNNLLLHLIITDLNKLFYINDSIKNNTENNYKNILRDNFQNKLLILMKDILISKTTYFEIIVDELLILESIYFENKQIILIIKKIYDYQNNLKDYNSYYLSNAIFKIIIKYYQDIEFINILKILIKSDNVNITNNIIKSFSYLNDKNFVILFKYYKKIIKSQDYVLFFNSISKIHNKQDFIIDYLIKHFNDISSIDEIKFKILKNIVLNIYDNNLINKLLEFIKKIYSNQNKLILNKITDIIKTNNIIFSTLN